MAETARALGAWYTPAPLAGELVRWAVRSAGDSVLDPSCGDGAFLVPAADRLTSLGAARRLLADQLAGVDVDPRAVARAGGRLLSRHPGLRWSRLARENFFAFARRSLETVSFDAVVGNPPFLRTQGRSPAAKRRETELARRCGAALTRDASSWAAFVAVAAALVRPGGRLAMVVPREALFVNYARPLMEALRKRFARVRLAPAEGARFEGALVKVATLTAEGEAAGGTEPDPAPWLWERIPPPCRAALGDPATLPFSDLAEVLIGVVTGDRDTFLTRSGAFPPRYLVPCLSRPSQLAGAAFSKRDLAALERDGGACRLIALPPAYDGGDEAVDAWLADATRRGIPRRYKCRMRRPWFAVRRMLPPADLLLGYLVKRRPRAAANTARVHATNNLHRVYLRRGRPRAVAASMLNALTMLSIELLGRVGAGGVLKIEPGDRSRIRMIDPARLARAGDPSREIDAALRAGRDGEAFALADAWAERATGRKMAPLRRAQQALRDARLA